MRLNLIKYVLSNPIVTRYLFVNKKFGTTTLDQYLLEPKIIRKNKREKT